MRLYVLLLVRNSVAFRDIWRTWAHGVIAPHQVKFFIHYGAVCSDTTTDSWDAEHAVRSELKPTWASLDLVRAELLLLRAALQDYASVCSAAPADVAVGQPYFMLASEACLPAWPVMTMLRVLEADPRSRLRAVHPLAWSAQDHEKANAIRVPFNECARKTTQWFGLSRAHATLLVRQERMIDKAFARVRAPDEWVMGTMLLAMKEWRPTRVLCVDSTATVWEVPAPGKPPPPSPLWQPWTADVLQCARSQGALFVRKFRPGTVSVEAWQALVCTGTPVCTAAELSSMEVCAQAILEAKRQHRVHDKPRKRRRARRAADRQ